MTQYPDQQAWPQARTEPPRESDDSGRGSAVQQKIQGARLKGLARIEHPAIYFSGGTVRFSANPDRR